MIGVVLRHNGSFEQGRGVPDAGSYRLFDWFRSW
jgi:hypothetical protein